MVCALLLTVPSLTLPLPSILGESPITTKKTLGGSVFSIPGVAVDLLENPAVGLA
jgi:hypothetical protein